MSTHPNVILMAVLTPDGLSRKTMREILVSSESAFGVDSVKIEGEEYFSLIMGSDYEQEYQIAANEGDLIFFKMVTYGYGETIEWDTLQLLKDKLKKWTKKMCKQHNCTYTIKVTANYW